MQNIALSIIAIALIIIVVMVARGRVGNISVSMPAPDVQVQVNPAEVIPEFHCPEVNINLPIDRTTYPATLGVTTYPAPYVSRYNGHTALIEIMVKRHASSVHGREGWLIDETYITLHGSSLWKCDVRFQFGLVETYIFDEITGVIQ